MIEKSGKIKPLFLSSYSQYERSLNKTHRLAGRGIWPCRTTPRSREKGKFEEFLERSLRETQKLKEEILIALQKTTDFALIAENILARDYTFPTIMGPREALLINVTAMVKSIYHEFVKVP